jgi:SAM-dependent methyltransferase
MPVQTATAFDAARYTKTTRQQWEDAAQAWHRWGPQLERWLGEATEAMLAMAGAGAGDRVLDVAAGAGGQTVAAARLVGPDGRVLATDISSNILERAALEARRAGLGNVETRVMDGERLDVEEASFDAVISRLGFISFPDRQAALRGMWRALKPGGAIAGVVYSTPEKNELFSIPVGIIRRRAQLPAPAPDQPGAFSFGAPGAIEAAFERAGFVGVEVRRVDAPVRMGSAAECVAFERESFGALHQMLSGVDDAGREAAWREIELELRRFERPGGFEGPCELIVAAGRRPR